MRDKNGCIILDEYQYIDDFVKGRKRKIWFKDKQNNKFLFKIGASNYEIWAELFASEIGIQCGFDMALYDLAVWKGNIGVLTPDFKKSGDLIISGEHMLKQASNVIKENNLNYDVSGIHSVEDVILAIGVYTGIKDLTPILTKLVNLWGLDGLLMESDRNSTNWSLIQNGQSFDLSPFYDFSTMARMNNDISNLVGGLRNEGDIAKMTDEIQTSLSLQRIDDGRPFLQQFGEFCSDFPNDYVQTLMDRLSKVNVELAIKNIENRLNYSKDGDNIIEFPWEVKYWLQKVIYLRLKEMLSIYEYSKDKKKRKVLL